MSRVRNRIHAIVRNAEFKRRIIVDLEDQYLIDERIWYETSVGYVATTIDGKMTLLHRILFPSFKLIDHKNNDKFDNRKENLREATHAENTRNRGKNKNNLSGYKGVSKNKKRFMAQITADGMCIHLGTYDSTIEAALIYNEAALKYHKNFACLNEIYSSLSEDYFTS